MIDNPKTILVVDDDETVCRLLSVVLSKEGYKVKTVLSAQDALGIIINEEFSCVLCDIFMPEMDGIEFLGRARQINPKMPIIMISGTGTHDKVIKALEMGANDFIAKPFGALQIKDVVRETIEKKKTTDVEDINTTVTHNILKQSYVDLLMALATILEKKDSYTHGHSERVKEYSVKIGRKLGVDEEGLEILSYAAMLHDIGKIALNDSILAKKTDLDDKEWEEIKEHPIVSSDILSSLKLLHAELPVVKYHHERYDGNGYPEGLKGEEIPLFSRILAVTDSYDAMVSERPYRKAMSKQEAIDEIKKCSGTQFDPKIVELFLEVIGGNND